MTSLSACCAHERHGCDAGLLKYQANPGSSGYLHLDGSFSRALSDLRSRYRTSLRPSSKVAPGALQLAHVPRPARVGLKSRRHVFMRRSSEVLPHDFNKSVERGQVGQAAVPRSQHQSVLSRVVVPEDVFIINDDPGRWF